MIDHTGEGKRFGRAIRGLRLLQNLSQEELCRSARIAPSTLYKVEAGHLARASTYRKICEALQTLPDELLRQEAMEKTKERLAVAHRAAEAAWYAPIDRRRIVPEDNAALLQNPLERQRLGRLGLVPMFACYPNLLMPDGPGATLLELYGHYGVAINAPIYREALMFCLTGGVRMQVGKTVHTLTEGDILGYTNREMQWIEPIEEAVLPVRLHWVGAVRFGKVTGWTMARKGK